MVRQFANKELAAGKSPDVATTIALSKAKAAINSGTALPKVGLLNSGDSFVKLVPSGADPRISPYVLSLDQYSALKAGSNNIFNDLSLYDTSFYNAYDAHLFTVRTGHAPLSFSSEIAPAMSKDFGVRMGGLSQTIIPNTSSLEWNGLIESLINAR